MVCDNDGNWEWFVQLRADATRVKNWSNEEETIFFLLLKFSIVE